MPSATCLRILLLHVLCDRKVLACLQILGRGNCFDDIPTMSFMSEQTIQYVFHEFTERFAHDFYPKHVLFPEGEYRKEVMAEYADVGFPGCIGSTDVTHVHWVGAPHGARTSYVGKEGYPTVAFEVTCDHKLRCLGATRAFPGAHNDCTIVKFDATIRKVMEECKDVEYTLLNSQGEEYTARGLYVIVDGGYPNVSNFP